MLEKLYKTQQELAKAALRLDVANRMLEQHAFVGTPAEQVQVRAEQELAEAALMLSVRRFAMMAAEIEQDAPKETDLEYGLVRAAKAYLKTLEPG